MAHENYIASITVEEKVAFDRFWKTFNFRSRSDFIRAAVRAFMDSKVKSESMILEALEQLRCEQVACKNLVQVAFAMQVAQGKMFLATNPGLNFNDQEEADLYDVVVEERFWTKMVPLAKKELHEDKTLDVIVIERQKELGVN